MPYKISPLPGQSAFGAVVTALAPEDLGDPAVQDSLRKLWIDVGVVVFRGMAGGEETHLRLSRIFGNPITHPMFRDRPDCHPELLDLFYLGGDIDDTQVLYEIDGEQRGGWQPWHSDLIYTHEINRGGILRPVQLPARGGGKTGFIDRIHAYATLPKDLQQRIEGLEVLYRPYFDASHQRFGQTQNVKLARPGRMMERLNAAGMPRTIHPLVFTQAETGRKVLNVSPWFADAINGMENAEGDAILKAVIEHCIRPELAYFHDWAMDEMVLWDNWRMMHCATGVAADDVRKMRRTTIAGDYALGRVEQTAAPEARRVGA